jgi:hypothetical protein
MTEQCKKCHRVLKNPMSVTHGYGPTCWKKVQHMVELELQDRKDKVYMNVNQNYTTKMEESKNETY